MTQLLQILALAVFVGLVCGIVLTATSIIRRRHRLQDQQPLLGVVLPQTSQDAVSAPKTPRKVK
jgi:uncharacterized membrane protein affecting hemolysin expression